MRITSIIGLIVLIILLTACGHQEIEVLKIGAITRTEYWKTEPLRWEGASRHYEYAELCSPKLPKCLRGKYLTISQFVSPTKGKLAVTFLDGTWSDPPEIRKAHSHLLDTITGVEIKCENCNLENLYFGIGDWLKQGTVFSPATYRLQSNQLPRKKNELEREQYPIYFIEFRSVGDYIVAVQRTITAILIKNSKAYGMSYSPSLNTWASLQCAPKCEIQWLNESLSGYKTKPTGCASEQLFIIWDGDEPNVVFSNWAQAKDICLDNEGRPMFRQLSYEEELALTLAQPGRGNLPGVSQYMSQEAK